MNQILKAIEKTKSFDKRFSILFNGEPFPLGDDLRACLLLVVDKAKYGEHFAQIAYLCEKRKINALDIILRCGDKAIEHPSQTGKVLRALFLNGFADEGAKLWASALSIFKDEPSFYAQILAKGHWFPEVRSEALKLIAEFKASSDGPEYGELTDEEDPPEYINI